jgi:hypothetical protein
MRLSLLKRSVDGGKATQAARKNVYLVRLSLLTRSVGGGKATQAAGGVATGASLHTYKTELSLLLPASTLI